MLECDKLARLLACSPACLPDWLTASPEYALVEVAAASPSLRTTATFHSTNFCGVSIKCPRTVSKACLSPIATLAYQKHWKMEWIKKRKDKNPKQISKFVLGIYGFELCSEQRDICMKSYKIKVHLSLHLMWLCFAWVCVRFWKCICLCTLIV